MLENMLQRLGAMHGVVKDPQADALIRERLAGQPDALYLLVQRTLLLEHALDDARRQLAQRPATPADPGGAAFLRRGLEPGFGRDPADREAYAPERAPSAGAPSMAPASAPAPAPGWRDRLFGGAAAAPAAPAAGGRGFLGQAASAAAGVAGGMFLFNGIEHLLGGGRGGGIGGGGSGFLGLGGQPGNGGPTEVIENVTQNFHAEPGGGDVGNGGDGGNAGGGDGMRQLADDAGAGWSGFDDDAAFDDDRFV